MAKVLGGALVTLIVAQGMFVARTSPIIQGPPTALNPSFTLSQPCQSVAQASPELSALLKQIAIQPSVERFSAVGMQFAKQQQYACGIPAFEAALRLDPRVWEARYNLAVALAQTGDSKRAASELRTVLQQKPDYPPAHDALGSVLQSTGNWDAAAEQFQAALRIDPHFPQAAFNLSEVFQSQKKYAAQVYYLRRTLASNPPKELEFQARLALGDALEQMGDASGAMEELRKLVAAFPGSAEAHDNLGNAYARHFRFREARREYEQTLRIDHRNNSARLFLAKALLELGERSTAISSAQEYIGRTPADYEGYLVLGLAYRLGGDFGKAEEPLRHAVKLKPDDYEARYALGMLMARVGKTEEAIHELEAAKKLNPDAPEPHYELSRIYTRQQDTQRAKEEADAFQQARERAGKARTVVSLRIKADALLQKGEAQDAANTYREALKITPGDPTLHYNLSLALAKLEEQAEEKQQLEEAVKLGPNVAEPHNRLGTIYLGEGKTREAQKEFEWALALNPTLVEAMNNLGILYSGLGNNRAAIEQFREAAWMQPEFAAAHANLGLALAAAGSFEEAQRELNRALRLDPQNQPALAGLRMLKAQRVKPQVPVRGAVKPVN